MTTRNYGKRWLSAALAGLALLGSSATTQLLAQNTTAAPAAAPAAAAPAAPAAPATPPPPTLDQRVFDLEAEVNNSAPGTTTAPDPKDPKKTVTLTWTSNLTSDGPGHNAWLLTSTAFVLMMTLPGLALFYGGLVRRKNVVSVLAQCFGITGLVSVLWWLCGYSWIFGKGFQTTMPSIAPFLGGNEFDFFQGVTSVPNTDYAYWVSQNVFACFQLMFAIITPALIVGSIAERMKYSALMIFMTAWMFIVYFPLAHMVWGISGWMNGCWNANAVIKAIDFAGGTVVHMSSGWSAFTLCLILGPRLGFGKVPMPPHSIVNVLIGTGLLWVGWYGFNSGSAVAGDVIAANAFTTTTMATAIGAFVWAMVEWIVKGKPTTLGYCSGAVAGLVVITPAAGYVSCTAPYYGAIWIGVAAGIIPFFFCYKVKGWFGYDDALDTFGVHAVGGTTGAIMTGIFADPSINANLPTNLASYLTGPSLFGHTLYIQQFKAVGVTLVLAIVGTAIIGYALKFTIGLRPTPEQEEQGLDLTDHSEEGYIL